MSSYPGRGHESVPALLQLDKHKDMVASKMVSFRTIQRTLQTCSLPLKITLLRKQPLIELAHSILDIDELAFFFCRHIVVQT